MKKYQNITITKDNSLAELGATYKSKTKPADRLYVQQSGDMYDYLKSVWDADKLEYIEEVVVLMLDRANKILGWAKVSTGNTSAVLMCPKVIFQLALVHNASAIVLSHNHPSGNLKASTQDVNMTKRIIEAGKILGIDVLDHIIITESGYYSFGDDGMI